MGVAASVSEQCQFSVSEGLLTSGSTFNTSYCPQVSPLYPNAHHDIDLALEQLYRTDEFQLRVADNLGAIVRAP